MTVILAGFLLIPAARAAAGGGSESIAAIVNNDAITASDLAMREKLMIASAGLPPTPDVYQKLRGETLGTLIEERLMMQEGARDGVKVGQPEIDAGFTTVAKQNNVTGDQFKQMMLQSQIDPGTLAAEIEAQIAWGKVIQQKIRPEIDVSDTEIDDGMARVRADLGKTQYLVAEIFLPVQTPQDETSAHQLADRLVGEINEHHTPFQRVAGQFSQAPGADKGGDLGWVQPGQLPPELDRVLSGMSDGDLSRPVRAADGYHILYVRKKQTVTEQSLPSRDEMRQKIGMDKLDRAQRRLLQDLKASAFIERRS